MQRRSYVNHGTLIDTIDYIAYINYCANVTSSFSPKKVVKSRKSTKLNRKSHSAGIKRRSKKRG